MASRITEKAVRKTIDTWFGPAKPTWLVPEGEVFEGVIVFERILPSQDPLRLAIAASSYERSRWEQQDRGFTMPAGGQPNNAWAGARAVGFAQSREVALALLFPEQSK